jgi:predicted RNase H-like HicB family nuclease
VLIVSQSANQFPIEVEQETDGRWIAAIPEVPGVMAYGATPEQAIVQVKALMLQVMGGETALLSEQALAQDWYRSEEDAAWSYLQSITLTDETLQQAVDVGLAAVENGEYDDYDEAGLEALFDRVKQNGRNHSPKW